MDWQKRKSQELSPELVEEYQLSPMVAKLFSLRGIDTAEKIDFWFNGTEEDLEDPYLMHDMDKAVNRINKAIDNFEKITVYGDYDADGITATTIMVEMLSIMGADVHYFIPDRFKDGYGPNMNCYKKIVSDGTKLIITVDNGITGVSEVEYAKNHGVDTIITDHHTFQEQVPDAYAVVHCNYPGQSYPFDDYCGAGVAYTIARAVMQDTAPEFLELAMIGTIGDMVKVSGEGHIIVKRGLKWLNQTSRLGLQALIKNAGLNLGSITESDIGFYIAPRLNACGRLDSANLAVQLLLCDDPEEAQKLADKIENLNTQRKELTEHVYQDAIKQIKELGYSRVSTLVLYNPEWHEGVLGLVANKIVEKTRKPAILLTKNDQGMIKGSGRSIEGFNIFNALEPFKGDILTQFGGHDFACGLSLEEKNIDKLREKFEESFIAPDNFGTHEYDFEINPRQVNLDVINEINLVGPFGTDNPEPVFIVKNPQIDNLKTMGQKQNHIRFTVNGLQIVGFGMADLTSSLLPFVKAIYIKLSVNEWNGNKNIQGLLQDISFGAPKLAVPSKVIDLRNESKILYFADEYLLFDNKNISLAQNQYGIKPEQIKLVSDYQDSDKIVTLLDAPKTRWQLDDALNRHYGQLYLRFQLDQLPVTNIPSRDAFGKVLKYVYKHPGLKPNDYRVVAPYLGLDSDTVYFILRVFFELKFVTIDDVGLMPNRNTQKRALQESKYYSAIKSELNFIHQLRTMPTKQLVDYANHLLH